LTPLHIVLLCLVVLSAITVETASGFGATLVTVTLSAFFLPIDTVLGIFIPMNLVLSSILVYRYHRFIARRLLFVGVVPLMAAGMALAILVLRSVSSEWLRTIFAGFVVTLAAIEIVRARSAGQTTPLVPSLRGATLFGAGIVHGLFGCGGPMVVYVVAREIEDKAAFRSTLSALWPSLNGLLVFTLARAGHVSLSSLRVTALLALPLLGGMALGERIHARVPQEKFRRALFVGLVVAGTLLLGRSILVLVA